MSDAGVSATPSPATTTAPTPAARAPAVLVVEDNDIIAGMLAAVLAREGLRVIWARQGAAGLAEFTAGPAGADIALVLADLRLPDMDGTELIRRVRDLRPGVPVLLSSGLVPPPLPPDPLRRFLPKPFSPVQLLAAVRELRAAAAAPAAPAGPAGPAEGFV